MSEWGTCIKSECIYVIVLYMSTEKIWRQTQHSHNSKHLKVLGGKCSYEVTWEAKANTNFYFKHWFVSTIDRPPITTHTQNHRFPSPLSNVKYLVHEIISFHGFNELSKKYKECVVRNKSFHAWYDVSW